MARIFISYRRADSQDFTNRIHQQLAQHFGAENIFIDREDIPGGADFLETIFGEIARCDVMLVIMGPIWSTLKGNSGDVRLFEDGDVVRAEVETGLRLPSVMVIPVLVDGGVMPPETALPKSIRKIVTLNAPSVRPEPDFDTDIQRLIRTIEQAAAKRSSTETTPLANVPPPPTGNRFTIWYQRLSSARKIIVWLAGLLVGTLTLALAALPLLTNDQLDKVRLQLGLITPVPTESTPTLQVDERSELISQDALRISLQDVASNPRDLVIAPSPQGLALWGYSGAGGDLFALDIASGTPLAIGQADGDERRFRMSDFENALTSALYYDEVWLWVGDSRNHRLLAFDPATMELVLEVPLGDDGQPVAIAHTGAVLWIALQDTGQVTAIQVDHAARSFDFYCRTERLAVGESPFAFVAQGQSSVWVAYGRGNGAVRRIGVQNCDVADELLFENAVQSITLFEDTLWGVSGDALWQLVNDAIAWVELPDIHNIETIQSGDGLLWLTTANQQLVSYNPQASDRSIVLSLSNPASDVVTFGVQTWVATQANAALRFTIPQVVYPDLAALAWQNDRLWAIDTDGQVCALQGDPSCFQLDLSGIPIVMGVSSAENQLWLSTDDGSVWRVNISTQTAEKAFNLPQPASSLAEAGQYLWATDGATMLMAVDLNSNVINDILASNFNIMPPVAMTFDGSILWFAYDFPTQIVSITYDGTTPRQSPLLSLDANSITALVADDTYIYTAEAGRLFIIDPQQRQVIGQFGLDSNPSGLANGTDMQVWSYNIQTGFIYQH